jgi:hypothetical protein
MSSSSAPTRPIRERITIAVVVGILAFAVVAIVTDSNLQLPAGIGAAILAWFATAPSGTEESKK